MTFPKLITWCLAATLIFTAAPLHAWLIPSSSVGYQGPGDVHAFTFWYGLRAYTAAEAAAGTKTLVNIRRASDSRTCDVLVATTGGVGLTTGCSNAGSDGSTPTAFCNGTTCTVLKIYDHVAGNACNSASCDLTPTAGTTSFRIDSVSGLCGGPAYCIDIGSGNTEISANTFTPSAAKLSFSTAAKITTHVGSTRFLGNVGTSNFFMGQPSTANKWQLAGGVSGTINVTANDNVWHVGNAVINGASSIVMVDGVDSSTATVTAATTAAAPFINAGGGNQFIILESGAINNYALTSGERTSLDSQQRAFWGF